MKEGISTVALELLENGPMATDGKTLYLKGTRVEVFDGGVQEAMKTF